MRGAVSATTGLQPVNHVAIFRGAWSPKPLMQFGGPKFLYPQALAAAISGGCARGRTRLQSPRVAGRGADHSSAKLGWSRYSVTAAIAWSASTAHPSR